jgi:hypothetical protein
MVNFIIHTYLALYLGESSYSDTQLFVSAPSTNNIIPFMSTSELKNKCHKSVDAGLLHSNMWTFMKTLTSQRNIMSPLSGLQCPGVHI